MNTPLAPNGSARPERIQGDAPSNNLPQRKPLPPGVDMEQVNRAMYEIEQADKSDVEGAGFDAERERYQEKGQKRTLDSNRAEQIRRKVRHVLFPSM